MNCYLVEFDDTMHTTMTYNAENIYELMTQLLFIHKVHPTKVVRIELIIKGGN